MVSKNDINNCDKQCGLNFTVASIFNFLYLLVSEIKRSDWSNEIQKLVLEEMSPLIGQTFTGQNIRKFTFSKDDFLFHK